MIDIHGIRNSQGRSRQSDPHRNCVQLTSAARIIFILCQRQAALRISPSSSVKAITWTSWLCEGSCPHGLNAALFLEKGELLPDTAAPKAGTLSEDGKCRGSVKGKVENDIVLTAGKIE